MNNYSGKKYRGMTSIQGDGIRDYKPPYRKGSSERVPSERAKRWRICKPCGHRFMENNPNDPKCTNCGNPYTRVIN